MEIDKCEKSVMFRYTWPGKDERFVCSDCAIRLAAIAQALGFFLQVIRLNNEELLNELTCKQIISIKK